MEFGDKSLFCQFLQTQRRGVIAVHKPFGLTDLEKDVSGGQCGVFDFADLFLLVVHLG
jgi:hypothetical protein